MTHALKIWPEFFKAVVSGEKTFEVRTDDRPFILGDVLLLQEWDPEAEEYTRREQEVSITYLMREDADFGIPGKVIMAIKHLERF